jgi:hypothetical protein
VPHVEFKVSEQYVSRARLAESSLDRWVRAVAGAAEPCLVIDKHEVIRAMSGSFVAELGLPASPVGSQLVHVLDLLDFSADAGDLGEGEVVKIPPLLALHSGGLARGLVRLRCAEGQCTFDAVSTPLGEGCVVTGSLTFFTTVRS